MRKKPIVAILYDFDSTLSRTDMQNFGFIPSLGMTPAEFWGATGKFSEETGCERTLAYLYMMQKLAAEKGIKMTKEWLKEQGKGIEFYNGVETWFDRINAYGKEHGVNVEHYLISSGNKEIVEGCKIAKQFKVIYGCEYIFDPVTGVPVWPKLAINYTQKTQYFFRISKGAVDATDDKGVNEKAKEKRIPYSNIIYIGDGMTDIPSMIIVKDNGGKSIAVYPKGKEDRVKDLYDDGRVNYVCPANYKEGSEIEKVMKLIIQGVAINESLKTRENQNVMQD
ncbi:MAG: haloacid dehalogenase-like hydrolase [Bacilli bacterium]|jgi:phosphoserine phosphatase|nr:haloacid dehalogenase-like hydrolase [Bacilli bacterium]MBQ4182933.1 haloacid dehalogenase-like hydrolase [Bacilli bacterium]MCR5091193.1 haloacid dehalogenase-like hydrolase [Bacilli bacterium]MEE3431587.1 haloacid dehalogenase-like hydrolase [Candidatus Enteromonas sp.]